ncbi:cytochrome c' domain-containing protein [Ditylenchus destructor]|nr:cytochrome c' domain-containing protein [Ditylenchus destructor]
MVFTGGARILAAVSRDLEATMTFKKLTVVLLACLTLSACGGVDPNSPLGQRKAIFKQMLKTGEDLGGMLRGRIPFDGAKFAEGAVRLDALSHEPWKHFRACAKKITPVPRMMSGKSRRSSSNWPATLKRPPVNW